MVELPGPVSAPNKGSRARGRSRGVEGGEDCRISTKQDEKLKRRVRNNACWQKTTVCLHADPRLPSELTASRRTAYDPTFLYAA